MDRRNLYPLLHSWVLVNMFPIRPEFKEENPERLHLVYMQPSPRSLQLT